MSQAVLNIKNNKEKEEFFLKWNIKAQFIGFLFIFIVICGIFIGSYIFFKYKEDMQQFSISKLVITGEYQYTCNDDIHQSIMSLGTSNKFMSRDVNAIQRQIKHIPWIEQVNITKHWFGELNVHLVEYVPVARWNDKRMIDMNGNLFNVPIDRINNSYLPILYGPEGSEKKVLKNFYEMNKVLIKNKFILKEVVMTTRHSWQLTLKNDIKLNLGRSNIIERLIRFVEFYPILLQQVQNINKHINYIDLRYDSGMAVGWDLAS